MILWIQSVNLVGCLHYFSGNQVWMIGAKTIHGISKAGVCIVGAYVVIFMAVIGGRTAGPVPRD